MKQELGSHNCLAVVAAMATNTTPEQFEKFFSKKEAPYSMIDLVRFLFEKGYTIGVGAGELRCGEYTEEIYFSIKIKDWPAVITIESEVYKGLLHLIYWDGSKICDPNPEVEDGRCLSKYKIKEWFPINKIED